MSLLETNAVPPSIVAFVQAQSIGTVVRVAMTPSLFNQIRVDLQNNFYTIPIVGGFTVNVKNPPFKYDCNQQLRPLRFGIALNQYLQQTIQPMCKFQEYEYQPPVRTQQTTTPWKYTTIWTTRTTRTTRMTPTASCGTTPSNG
jgi:hypothetical protein